MIWLRRTLAIILAFIFIITLPVILVLYRVNSTVASPGFYTQQLRKADVYNYLYDKVLPAALDELEADTKPTEIPIDFARFKVHIIAAAKDVLPPQWIQSQVEQTMGQVFPYMLGDSEKFSIYIPLKDRVETTLQVFKSTLKKPDVFPVLYDQIVNWAVDNLPRFYRGDIPLINTLTKDEMTTALKKLVPQEWLLQQIVQAIDEITPYLTGKSEHFAITISLADRVDSAAEVIISVLSKQETYDYLFKQMVEPAVKENISKTVTLPFGVSLTNEEVVSAVKEVLPQSWVNARLQDLVNQSAAYLKGTAKSFEIIVPLADRKDAALRVIDELADRKLYQLWQSLPECSLQQLPQLLSSLAATGKPTCRPATISYDDFKSLLQINIQQEVSQQIGQQIPDRVTFSEADLRNMLGERATVLDDARKWVSQSLSFSDADLQKWLDTEGNKMLNDARRYISSGFTFTEKDLREQISKDNKDAEMSLNDFDQARHQIHRARQLLFVLWLIPALLLICIGLLGGKRIWSKIAWAAVVLAIASLIIFIITGPIFNGLARPQIDSALAEMKAQATDKMSLLMMDKAGEIANNAIATFISGIRNPVLVMLIVSLIVLVLCILWRFRPDIFNFVKGGHHGSNFGTDKRGGD